MSKRMLLLPYLAGGAPQARELLGPIEVLTDAWRAAPDVVRDLLALPWFGAWLARCVRRFRRALAPVRSVTTDLAYLGAVAAVAAARAGVDAKLTTLVRGGRVVLPDTGAAVFGAPDRSVAQVQVRDGVITVSAAGQRLAVPAGKATATAGWLPLRRLTVDSGGLQLSLAVEDLDEYRDCHGEPVAGRLTDVELARWEELAAQAWPLLVRYAPDRAAEIVTGLTALVPVDEASTRTGLSVSCADAFGGFALNRPVSGAAFALTMVHEFQHSKLSALLDLTALYDGTAATRYFAPWRQDPRPVGGLIQGAYAFLGVADAWRALRAAPGLHEPATRQFAELREQVADAVGALLKSDQLTATGHRFVAGMWAAVEGMFGETVPAEVAVRGRQVLLVKRMTWRLHHVEPDPAQVARLAAEFTALAGSTEDDATVRSSAPGPAVDPAGGSHDDLRGWVDRALAACGRSPHAILTTRPELVRAVAEAICAGGRPAPRLAELAAWLGSMIEH